MSRKTDKTSDTESLFDRADVYEERGDFASAFRCLFRAAELGDSWGQVNVGNFYAAGKGVRKNLDKAAYWYKKAYRGRNSAGALNLAIDRKKGAILGRPFFGSRKLSTCVAGMHALSWLRYIVAEGGTKERRRSF